MAILVIDLEATCDDGPAFSTDQMEIIEIGAVWATTSGEAIAAFKSYVRPLVHPTLSDFCTSLTGIAQADVDAAPTFAEVASKLASFAKQHLDAQPIWGSWGKYDFNQIARECERHGISNPLDGFTHRNLKREFARQRKIKEVGMAKALQIAGLPLQGAHHRALDDAKNIATLLPWCAPL